MFGLSPTGAIFEVNRKVARFEIGDKKEEIGIHHFLAGVLSVWESIILSDYLMSVCVALAEQEGI